MEHVATIKPITSSINITTETRMIDIGFTYRTPPAQQAAPLRNID